MFNYLNFSPSFQLDYKRLPFVVFSVCVFHSQMCVRQISSYIELSCGYAVQSANERYYYGKRTSVDPWSDLNLYFWDVGIRYVMLTCSQQTTFQCAEMHLSECGMS